jgi:hypothetical protein
MYRILQVTLFLTWAVHGGLGFLIKRDPVSIAVPITGNLTNTSAHYDPVSWTLWNPVFNQTTWEAQPYVLLFCGLSNVRYRMDILDTESPLREWDIGKRPMRL